MEDKEKEKARTIKDIFGNEFKLINVQRSALYEWKRTDGGRLNKLIAGRWTGPSEAFKAMTRYLDQLEKKEREESAKIAVKREKQYRKQNERAETASNPTS